MTLQEMADLSLLDQSIVSSPGARLTAGIGFLGDGAIRFRFFAPGARSVSLIGAFNERDPQADRLTPLGGGFWQLDRRLPAGLYVYEHVGRNQP